MLTCKYDSGSNFYIIVTKFGYDLGTVKILVEFVDGISSLKGVEMVGVENFNLRTIPLQLKMERHFKLEKLASY